MNKICVVYSHHKLGDLIWQLPYIKAISCHHKSKVDLIVRKKTQSKEILCDTSYINHIYYNNFRKSFFYWIEVFKLFFIFKKKKYNYIYFLDKINRPAIAAYFAKIPNRIGLGIGNQKKWLTNKLYLTENDNNKLDYSDQSRKFLKINKIKIEDLKPSFEIKNNTLNKIPIKISTPINQNICFGVDSFEKFKIWKEENFAELADLLFNHKFGKNFFLVSDPSRPEYPRQIISSSKNKIFINCSSLNLLEIIKVIKNCKMYIGNNSGPLNLASALGIKSFGLIAADNSDELKNSNIICITPINYNKKNFTRDKIVRDRSNMDNLSVDRVFSYIKNHYKFLS